MTYSAHLNKFMTWAEENSLDSLTLHIQPSLSIAIAREYLDENNIKDFEVQRGLTRYRGRHVDDTLLHMSSGSMFAAFIRGIYYCALCYDDQQHPYIEQGITGTHNDSDVCWFEASKTLDAISPKDAE